MINGFNDGTRSPVVCFPPPGSMNPILGYLFSAAVAIAFYIIWLWAVTAYAAPRETASLEFRLWFVVSFAIFGGFVPALGLMIAPWLLVVRRYRRVQLPGWIYFPVAGAVSTIVVGCITLSLAPKPLFIDQTFFEGAVIAVEREGVCMLLAGLLFGMTYWFLSGRRRTIAISAGAGP